LMRELSPLTFSVNIDRYVVIPAIYFFCCLRIWLCTVESMLLLSDFFSCCLILSVFSWFCLLSSSVCRISYRIFCSGGLVVMYCFSFCLLWKIFIAPSILMIVLLGTVPYPFSAWNISLHALLAFKVSI
jgi:hypothetical protein